MDRMFFSRDGEIGKRFRSASWFFGRLIVLVVMVSFVSVAALTRRTDENKALKANKFCSATTEAAFTACQSGAEDNYWIAIGNCNNLSDPDAREGCMQEAKVTRRNERRECNEQKDLRDEVCDALGEGPYDPQISPAMFVDPTQIGRTIAPNPYFLLIPGRTMVYMGGGETVRVAVTRGTRKILGVTCAVVHDVVEKNGAVIEDTIDWYAQDINGNIWYFGEIAQTIEDGVLVNIDGSWVAGVSGAKPGFAIKAANTVGNVYRQEFSLGNAEDLAEVLSLTGSATVPAASCNGNCLVTKEFAPIIPGLLEHKYYARGVGFILEINPENGERLELVQITNN